jgi:2-methylisocitrate lyase-like PEP mutase family enzyme
LVEAVSPKPVNLLVVADIGLRVADLAALGVRRVSVGGALALSAWGAFARAARTLKAEGSFAGLAGVMPYAEVNGFLAEDLRARQTRRT